jgi:hypothetical protein
MNVPASFCPLGPDDEAHGSLAAGQLANQQAEKGPEDQEAKLGNAEVRLNGFGRASSKEPTEQ